jgi:hypothetical protein
VRASDPTAQLLSLADAPRLAFAPEIGVMCNPRFRVAEVSVRVIYCAVFTPTVLGMVPFLAQGSAEYAISRKIRNPHNFAASLSMQG